MVFKNLDKMFTFPLYGYFFLLSILYVIYRLHWEFSVGIARRKNITQYGCEPIPKMPSKDPILGLDFFRERGKRIKNRGWLDYTYEIFTNIGLNTCQLNVLGRKLIFTMEAENIRAIHVTNFTSWGITAPRKKRLAPLIGSGIFVNDGVKWKHSRKLLRPSFQKTQITNVTMFENHLQRFLDFIPKDDSTIDLQKLFFLYTTDTATEFLLGDSSGASSSLGPEFGEAFDRCLETIGAAGKLQTFSFTRTTEYDNDVKLIQDTVDARIKRALDSRKGHDSSATNHNLFLLRLLDETDDKLQLRSELLNTFMAARDTTASFLSNTWLLLSKHPRVWDRVREEVAAFQGIPPTFDQITGMNYFRAVLYESLRLYPQVPENARVALRDTVLPRGGGADGKSPIFVPKGQMIIWSAYSLHRHKGVYGEDSTEFRPERWLDEDGRQSLKPGWGFLPFGGGPRSCPGQDFALIQTLYLSARLIQHFSRIESRDPEPWVERLAVVTTGFNGCKVALFRD